MTGDILNERTVTTFKQEGEGYQLRNDVASDASRFEATDTLKLNAGRDVVIASQTEQQKNGVRP
ncbi:hypothetical protein IFT48_26600 [Pseudomonas fluorescens]|uniref:hypothetical protein n=1 Tax=Pseudomonas fluorescens TaxID=294 RepID=UPI001904D87E|nr:hypothetical protein [Pseudomonas fluorescens]MBD8093567.1 hypothetical protein [Pseudomonas fluorescens]MBD8719649.1 hypothetical protein [Pseudomonas fluorescens]